MDVLQEVDTGLLRWPLFICMKITFGVLVAVPAVEWPLEQIGSKVYWRCHIHISKYIRGSLMFAAIFSVRHFHNSISGGFTFQQT